MGRRPTTRPPRPRPGRRSRSTAPSRSTPRAGRPNIAVAWDFCEFTYNQAQLFANLTFVDFASIPVALDLTVSDALRLEGYARETVRLIQEARKASGLDVSDRIVVRWTTADVDLAAALTEHGPMIAGEVLAVSFGPGAGPDGNADAGARGGAGVAGPWHAYADTDLGLRFWLAVAAA